MTDERIPDVKDPDIRRMVLRNHEPQEAWTTTGSLVHVVCEMCGFAWPCESIQAARRVERTDR